MSAIRAHVRRPRGIVVARRRAMPTDITIQSATAPATSTSAFAVTPESDLVFRGGRTIPDLKFRNCYLGSYWSTPPGAADRANIDRALAAAMSDVRLNGIVQQYFPGHPVTGTGLASIAAPIGGGTQMTKSDLTRWIAAQFASGGLAGLDLDNTALTIVLAPGVVLSSDQTPSNQLRDQPGAAADAIGLPTDEDLDSLHGLAGYHGSTHVAAGARVYFAAAVYSSVDQQNHSNGIAIPGWAPWENVVATFYHELNEVRTDPDVDDANALGTNKLLGWSSNAGEEIGDFPIESSLNALSRVFQRVDLADGSGQVPVQFLYSNAAHGPQGPSAGAPLVAAAAAPVRV